MIRHRLLMLVTSILLVLPTQSLRSQSPQPGIAHRYRVVELKKRKDLQPELDRAAAAGERLVWGNCYLGLLITELLADAAAHYEYLVRDLVYEDELKKAGEAGFKLPTGNRNAEQLFLEKPAGSTGKVDFVVLKTNRTSTLERQYSENVSRGYRPVWLGFGMRYMGILERDLSASSEAAHDNPPPLGVKLIAAERIVTVENELAEQAAQGYHVVSGILAGEAILLLEKNQDEKERYQYAIVREPGAAALQRELNEGGENGFRLIPSAVMSTRTPAFGDPTTLAVMEKAPSHQTTYEYLVLKTTKKTSELAEEISNAAANGYEFATASSGNTYRPVFIFERARKE